MNNLYIMCGLAFSGKSTLARKIAESTGGKLIAFDKLWVEKDKVSPVPKGDEGWRFIRKIGQDEVARRFNSRPIVVYLNTPLDLIRDREATNKVTGERHEVEPENFQTVLEQLEAPEANEDVLEFTPDMDIEKFISELPK